MSKHPFNFHLDDDQHNALKELAGESRDSIGWHIRHAIAAYLKREGDRIEQVENKPSPRG